ncbi:MAG: hypothetical protein U0K57_05855 [Lachnospiraceae bacterium]|nr:hypothetical protein [Lachnospiraceae bacterium]
MICQYVVLFTVYSFFGWIFECTYCTFKTNRWENRGFLFGPIIPIYGFGAIAASIVFGLIPQVKTAGLNLWQIFLVCAVGSAILEYITSFLLEKIFHAVWWDYSNMPLNLNGRICLPATCGFGAAGVLIVKYLIPFVESLHMEGHSILNQILALAFMALLGGDLTLTVDTLIHLVDRLEGYEKEFNDRMENLYQSIEDRGLAIKEKGEAVKLKTEEHREAIAAKARTYAEQMSFYQRYEMRNIKHMTRERTTRISDVVKEHLDKLKELKPNSTEVKSVESKETEKKDGEQ